MTEPEPTGAPIVDEAALADDAAPEEPVAPAQEDPELLNALECLLFAAKEPVPLSRLAEVLQAEMTDLPRLLSALAHKREGTGLDVAHLAGGYTLATRPKYAEYVQTLLEPDPQKLSIQALETLAIIAYRQPITRPEVDDIRGVNSSGSIASLIEKNLLRISGRKEAPGRPFLLATTPHFLSIFGLTDLGELPDIGELRRAMESQGLEPTPQPASEPAEGAGDGEPSGDLPEDLEGAL
jgi:segregation and condensation protein B